MPDGWFKLHRRIFTHPVFDDPELFRLWVWIVGNANWEERQLLNGETVKPGQLVVSFEKLGEMLNCHKTTIMRRLSKLEKAEMVQRKSQRNTQRAGTVLTICNWATYQNDIPSDATEHATEHATTTQRRRNDDATTTQLEEELKKERTKEQKKKEKVVSLPSCLNSEAFRAAWQIYVEHRRELKKPLTSRAAEMALKRLADWGTERAVAAIEYTVSMNWQGIREDQGNGRPASTAVTLGEGGYISAAEQLKRKGNQ